MGVQPSKEPEAYHQIRHQGPWWRTTLTDRKYGDHGRNQGQGISIKTPAGATVSFKRLDERDWEMVRDDGEKLVRTYNISADDRTLTFHDVVSGNAGDNYVLTMKYARLGPGKGILGEWQSVSMEEKIQGEMPQMIISPFEINGLSFSVPSRRHLSKMKFDGKVYADSSAGDRNGSSSSGRRLSEYALEIDSLVNGRLEDRGELKVSNDGKTLTVVNKPAKSTAVFTEVWTTVMLDSGGSAPVNRSAVTVSPQ